MVTETNIQRGRVITEGDELYYEARGNGQPLLMIPGGGGDGDYYSAVADILSDEFKVIIYDRRANARSTMNDPQNFEISQQSRDAVAVLHAVGEESAFVFGNSSGAVIALDMAKTQPQSVRAVVAHEPPIARLHSQNKKWRRFFARCYLAAFRFGPSLGALKFMLGIQVPVRKLIKAQIEALNYAKGRRKPSDEHRIHSKDATDFLIKQELLPVTNYLPDVQRIRENGTRVFIAIGEWALNKKAWYVQIAQTLAEKLGCDMVTFPGHHGSYMDMPKEWAATLRSVLRKAEKADR